MSDHNPEFRKKILNLFNNERNKNSLPNVKRSFIDKLISGDRKSDIFDSVVSKLEENDKAFLNAIRNKKQENQKPVNQVTTINNELDDYKGTYIAICQNYLNLELYLISKLEITKEENRYCVNLAELSLTEFEYKDGTIEKIGDNIEINILEQKLKREKFSICFSSNKVLSATELILHSRATFLSRSNDIVATPMILIKDSDNNLTSKLTSNQTFNKNYIEANFNQHSEQIFSFFSESGAPIIIRPYSPVKTKSTLVEDNSFYIGWYRIYRYSFSKNPPMIVQDLIEVYPDGMLLKIRHIQELTNRTYNYSGLFRVVTERLNIYIDFLEEKTKEEMKISLLIPRGLKADKKVILKGTFSLSTNEDELITKGVVLEKINAEPDVKITDDNRFISKDIFKKDKPDIYQLLEQMMGNNGVISVH